MSSATGSATRGRRLVVAAVVGFALVIAGSVAAAVAFPRSSAREPNGLCRIASNDHYVAVVERILTDYDYDRVVADPDATRVDPTHDAVSAAGDAAEHGFTPLFQMQACSIAEADLSGFVSDRGGIPFGLRRVIFDPESHEPGPAPIDIEVAWYAELGVEGLIGGWSTIARMDHESVGLIQRLLSLGLAHVTNPDRDAVLEAGEYPGYIADKDRHLGYEYVYDLTDLGGQDLELARYSPLGWARDAFGGVYLVDEPDEWELIDAGPRVYGWSVLAPLLWFGDFHEQFLTPVATAIIQFDRARGGNWLIEGEEPVSFDAYDDDPTNAMDAVLEALARNPAAAQAVFEATGDQRLRPLLGGESG
jgi:hypothetical protein